ncbi:interleukin-13 receptor subunit alpha-1-like isoform X2 [Antennarius striatus]|uniref:interleukin-13 receptor subunit alpha-1-like isoform X2 n=1 Tax=Antennarius striatus TaxID=241820 RepID=UPI0035B30ADF
MFPKNLFTGKISPPQNLTLQWITDFYPYLSWAPPNHSMSDCKYKVEIRPFNNSEDNKSSSNTREPRWTEHIVMEGGFLNLSVKTVCKEKESKQVFRYLKDPELVRDLQCSIHTSKQTSCSWTPAHLVPDLSFFYKLVYEDGRTRSDDQTLSWVQACSSYTYTNGVRTGCNFQAKITQDVLILVNGTVNNRTVKNTFRKALHNNVKPPPLEWEVEKTATKFLISWIAPEISNPPKWKFIINITECGKKLPSEEVEKTKYDLPLQSHCPYRMSVRAKAWRSETPWSKEKYFSADRDPNAFLYAIIFVALTAAILGAMSLMFLMKYKKTIFPKVPQPRDLLSDSDNNNKVMLPSFYSLAEEENCEITLVIDK